MNTAVQYFEAGGTLMIPLFLLCFAIWLWIVTLYPKLKREIAASRSIREILHGSPRKCVTETIRARAGENPGIAARILEYATAGVLERNVVRNRLSEARLAELPAFSRELGILKAMVAAAPLLGLLGTVKGMIATFHTLSIHGTASIELLSVGISEALVTTQVGLVVALPGFVALYAIGRRLRNLEISLDCLELPLLASMSRHRAQILSSTEGDAK